jgi:hypothetical protein
VARMPKYQKLRNARSRAFQRELLQRIDPKPNRLWIFLNSALFIWFLSAGLLTVGGGYITNHQQCMRDADQLTSRRAHLVSELLSRKAAFATSVANVKRLQPPFLPGKQGSLYPDLANVSYGEVEKEFWTIIERVEWEELPDKRIIDAQLRWLDYSSSRADREYERFRETSPFLKDDDTLKQFKKTVELQALCDRFSTDLDALAYSYQPDCTILKTLGAALGYKPRIVKAVVSPLFLLGDTHTILHEDIDDIEKLQRQG